MRGADPEREADALTDPPAAGVPGTQDRLVLVAEDNAINQRVFRRQLAHFGLAADIAGGGHEALELWRGGDYALLFTDLQMGRFDGYSLARAIRAEEGAGRRLPIIALTGSTAEAVAVRCLEAGMDGCLAKPVSLGDLEAVLRKWLPAAPGAGAAPGGAAKAAGHEAGGRAIDIEVLVRLVGDDPGFIGRFLRDFLATSARIEADLAAAGREGDGARMGAAAHKLLAAARAIGAHALAGACEDISQAGAGADMAPLLAAFQARLAAVRADIEAAGPGARDVDERR